VRANIAYPLDLAHVPASESREVVAQAAAMLKIEEHLDKKPEQLSGGQKQRVAIARAVVAKPELLLADEPTGNVDPSLATRLLHLFQELNRFGTTVLIATHDPHLIAGGTLPVLRLEKGHLN
jgi:cell division transport system ATP-binding protein